MVIKTKTSSSRKQRVANYVVIDHPQENEIINHPSYSIRIGASGSSIIEVSINGGDWETCRCSLGYWWYDWTNYPSGAHKIIARLCDNNGKVLKKSKIRKCAYPALSFIRNSGLIK